MFGRVIKGRGRTPPPADLTITLVAEAGDGDQAITNLITGMLDPAFA